MKALSYVRLCLAAVFLIGCASQTPEEREAKYVAKGDAKMEQAMGGLRTADDEYLAIEIE